MTAFSEYSRGCVLVIDESLRQVGVAVARRAAFDIGVGERRLLLDAVEPVDAGFDRRPRQEGDQPARRDARPLRMGLGGVGELARRSFAQRAAEFMFVGHVIGSLREEQDMWRQETSSYS